jgi:hypothetical protein
MSFLPPAFSSRPEFIPALFRIGRSLPENEVRFQMDCFKRSPMDTKLIAAIRFGVCLLLSVAAASMPASAATPTVTTVAGGYLGDGKQATSASFAQPASVVRDTKGNIYVGDLNNCRIRRINTNGVISTFAGIGICGYSGDGGLATSAMISEPYGLTFDSRGNLLVADAGNLRIRKISTTGIISTIAGNGTFGYSGDGGPAILASLGFPNSISADTNGNLYGGPVRNYPHGCWESQSRI